MDPSDFELAQSAIRGDKAAFRALFDRHVPSLFRMALSLTRNRTDAEDLLQEAMVAAFRGLSTFSGRASMQTWLVTILIRKHMRMRQNSRHHRSALSLNDADWIKRTEADDRGLVANGQTAAESVERRLHILEALRLLRPEHRQVLTLRDIQGLSYAEIGEALGVPRGTVESRLFRARKEFREQFGEICKD